MGGQGYLLPFYFLCLWGLLGGGDFPPGEAPTSRQGGPAQPSTLVAGPVPATTPAPHGLPLHFLENRGQLDAGVNYYAAGRGYTVWFSREGINLAFPQGPERADGPGAPDRGRHGPPNPSPKPKSTAPEVVRLIPMGMRPEVELAALEPQRGKVNYFLGNDPNKWRTGLSTYRKVVFREAYPGIDLQFYGTPRRLEYDVVVKPGADLSRVRFCYQGVKGLKMTPQGDLTVRLTGGGVLTQKKPVIYQELDGVRVAREGKFKLFRDRDQAVYGFEVAAYDRDAPLVIDPVLLYSTFLGGGDHDFGYGIAADAEGNAYVTGETWSPDFPGENPLAAPRSSATAFVTKISVQGDELIYSTFLGGSNGDYGVRIAVDQQGCAYVTGVTNSPDFPVRQPLMAYQGGRDVFVAKLNAAGDALVYATYLGGRGDDYSRGLALGSAGNVYITGYTMSPDFPTVHPLFTYQGGSDAFVAKLNAAGSALVYATYLGGRGYDYGHDIAVDGAGNAYVTGSTDSANFPTRNPIFPYRGRDDAFVTKINAAGTALVYSTFLGGASDDYGRAIAVGGSGNAFVAGETRSADFPTLNPFRAYQGNYDVFVTKLNADGSALVYSTYLGGSNNDYAQAIAVTGAGLVYVTGGTESRDFLVKSAVAGYRTGYEAFVTKINAAGTGALYSTFLSGRDFDYGYGLAVDGAGTAYVTGATRSVNFPAQNPLFTYHDRHDAFVTKIGEPCADPIMEVLLLGGP